MFGSEMQHTCVELYIPGYCTRFGVNPHPLAAAWGNILQGGDLYWRQIPPSPRKTYKLLVPIQAAVIHLYTGVVFMFFVFFGGKGGGGGGGETNTVKDDGDLGESRRFNIPVGNS